MNATQRNYIALTVLLALPLASRAEDAPLNYEQHVRPVLREHCFSCHNQEKSKSGLALDSFGTLMTGGAGGEVVVGGNLEGSRLWQLVSHQAEPNMPPNGAKLPDAQLATIRTWIEQGAIERVGGKPQTSAGAAFAFVAPAEQAGPGAMPSARPRQPVVHTERAGAVAALACSPNAPLLAMSGQRQVLLYHTQTNELLAIMPFPEGQPNSISFSRDGSLLVVGGGRAASRGLVALYDVATGDRLTVLGDELDAVLASDVDPSLQRVALGGPNKIVRLLDTSSGQQIQQMKRHTDWILAVAFSPDGKYLATADRQGGLWMWEADTGLEVQDFPGHKQAITGLSWRADSKVLASCSEDGNIRLWTINNGKQLRNWVAHPGGAQCVRFTHDGRLVSAGRDRKAKLWDAAGKELRSFSAFHDIALQVAVSHDAKQVFAADWTGQVRGWNTEDGAEQGAPSANPPTLELRLADAQRTLDARRTAEQDATAALAAISAELNAKQTELEKVASQLIDGWKQSIAALTEDDAPRPANLEQPAQQATQLSEQMQAAFAKATEARQTLTQAAQATAAAAAEHQQVERELTEFEIQESELQNKLHQAGLLTQQSEEHFESVERERLAIVDLIASADKVVASGTQPAINDVAMESDDAQPAEETSQPPGAWAQSVSARAKLELAACDRRLATASKERATASQKLARAKAQLELYAESYTRNE